MMFSRGSVVLGLDQEAACIILYVTEDQELVNGHKYHTGGACDSSFRDRLEAEGIAHHHIIHIKYIDVRDGSSFADNLKWLTALLAMAGMQLPWLHLLEG